MIAEPRYLLPATVVEPPAVALAQGDPRPADRRVDAYAGLLSEEHRVVWCRNPLGLELAHGDLHHDGQQVEALEAVDTIAVLAQTVRQAAVLSESDIDRSNTPGISEKKLSSRGPAQTTSPDRRE